MEPIKEKEKLYWEIAKGVYGAIFFSVFLVFILYLFFVEPRICAIEVVIHVGHGKFNVCPADKME